MMKKSMLWMLVFLMALVGFAKEQTIFQGRSSHGFYAAAVTKYTSIDDEFGVMVGGRLGWIINHTFSLGIAGYGWANGDDWDSWCGDDYYNDDLLMGYGGLYLEGIIGSNNVIHMTAGVLIGAGGVGDDMYWDDWEHHGHNNGDGDVFFVVEPEINLELNVTRWFRMGAGVSYRFISGVEHPTLSNDDLSGVAGVLSFKFGKF